MVTYTVLFTDIEGSTSLWEEHPEAMHVALMRHDHIVRQSIEDSGGHVFRNQGDSFCATFPTPAEALTAVLVAQRQLGEEAWPDDAVIRVRMGLHTGPCIEREGDYFGPVVNRTARLENSAHGGQVVMSEATARAVREQLPPQVSLIDVGLHRLKDLGRPERVFQLAAPGLSDRFPPLRSLENPDLPNNLPEQLTSFIGREDELKHIRELIDKARLVTLVGPGGAGKTRLALQVAAELLDPSREGVWLVELAAIDSAERVLSAVASALGVREKPGRPLIDTLVDVIGQRRMLIVLDNCEQVIDTAASIADHLLRACPGIRFLATSREPLAIASEWVYRVPSMAVPPPDSLSSAMQFDAVQLFVERAQHQQSDFVPDPHTMPTVIDLCRRLDGIPLAIELAVVRLRSMALGEILTRLDDRFLLLTGGSRTALARQQTLRATVDWSYDLLNRREALVLSLLSVFAGGFTVEDAERICMDGSIESVEFLHVLASLSDKSLVHADIGDVTRYRLNETIRQYAGERLAEQGESVRGAARDTHARVFLELAETAAPHLIGAEQKSWLERLEVERDNVRLAMSYLLGAASRHEQVLRFCNALRRFWFARGYWAEGSELFDAALHLPGSHAERELRAIALCGAGQMASRRSDHATARRHYEEGLELGRILKDDMVMSECLCGLAWTAFSLGERAAAIPIIDESLVHARLTGNEQFLGLVLERRASINYEDREACRADYNEALEHLRNAQDLLSIGVVENNLADLELNQGNHQRARIHLEAAMAISDTLHDESIMYNYLNLGHVALAEGDFDTARGDYLDSLRASRRAGDQFMIANSILCLALCLTAEGDAVGAAELHGISDALMHRLGSVLDVMELHLRDEDHLRLRQVLGDDEFERHHTRGMVHPEIDGAERALNAVR
jgi:predicted ATPase/class 3 adenylate cyclase